jgi:hypothetical protein
MRKIADAGLGLAADDEDDLESSVVPLAPDPAGGSGRDRPCNLQRWDFLMWFAAFDADIILAYRPISAQFPELEHVSPSPSHR